MQRVGIAKGVEGQLFPIVPVNHFSTKQLEYQAF